MTMTDNFRAEFDIPRDICYLNAAYMTPQPRRVVDAARRGAIRRAQPWRITPDDFFAEVEHLRAAFARLIECPADNIAIVPSAGYGVACAANNLATEPGDVILVLEDQFPSNYYAWRRRALASKAEIAVVSKQAGQSWAGALREAIGVYGERISIAALEAHHWSSAEQVDLDTIMPALRNVGARTVLDMTQTVGASPVDVGKFAPDFLVCAGYKWLFCPYGVSFLYVDERYFDGVPVEEAWMGREGADDFSRLSTFTDRYQAGARRFDVSEKSSFSNIAGALAALQMLEDLGIATISDALAATNLRIREILERHGFSTPDPGVRAAHFQGARLPDTDAASLAQALIERQVYASVRGDYLRVAPHLYTDDADLARFDDALDQALR